MIGAKYTLTDPPQDKLADIITDIGARDGIHKKFVREMVRKGSLCMVLEAGKTKDVVLNALEIVLPKEIKYNPIGLV